MTDDDTRGNCGAEADRSWTEVWSQWQPERLQEYIASAATFGPLSVAQAAAIVQGLPPPPPGWPEPDTVLEEFASIVERLRDDVERGQMSSTPMPEELAAWCDARRHGLPSPFVDELAAQSSRVAAPPGGAPQSTQVIKLPAWVPLSNVAIAPVPTKRKAGRPKTAEANHEALAAAATKRLMDLAAQGVSVSLEALARDFVGTPFAGGNGHATILRRLKGALPVQAAKAIAQRAQAKGRKPKITGNPG